jgi:hypothetical protein
MFLTLMCDPPPSLPPSLPLQTRPEAVSALRSAAEGYLSFASSSEPRYSHIPPEDRETVAREAGAALSWLSEWRAGGARCACWLLAPPSSGIYLGHMCMQEPSLRNQQGTAVLFP